MHADEAPARNADATPAAADQSARSLVSERPELVRRFFYEVVKFDPKTNGNKKTLEFYENVIKEMQRVKGLDQVHQPDQIFILYQMVYRITSQLEGQEGETVWTTLMINWYWTQTMGDQVSAMEFVTAELGEPEKKELGDVDVIWRNMHDIFEMQIEGRLEVWSKVLQTNDPEQHLQILHDEIKKLSLETDLPVIESLLMDLYSHHTEEHMIEQTMSSIGKLAKSDEAYRIMNRMLQEWETIKRIRQYKFKGDDHETFEHFTKELQRLPRIPNQTKLIEEMIKRLSEEESISVHRDFFELLKEWFSEQPAKKEFLDNIWAEYKGRTHQNPEDPFLIMFKVFMKHFNNQYEVFEVDTIISGPHPELRVGIKGEMVTNNILHAILDDNSCLWDDERFADSNFKDLLIAFSRETDIEKMQEWLSDKYTIHRQWHSSKKHRKRWDKTRIKLNVWPNQA